MNDARCFFRGASVERTRRPAADTALLINWKTCEWMSERCGRRALAARNGWPALSHWLRGTHFSAQKTYVGRVRPRPAHADIQNQSYWHWELSVLQRNRISFPRVRQWEMSRVSLDSNEICGFGASVSRLKFNFAKLHLPLDVKLLFFLIFVKHSREITYNLWYEASTEIRNKHLNLNRVFV
jgi:hypothetical protein